MSDGAPPPLGPHDRVRVGRVGRPHGLAGAFVVEDASEAPERFAVGARLFAGGDPAEVVESKRAGGGRLVIRLDRPVERGVALEIDRSDLPPPEEDAYYVFQLVGLVVEEEGGRTLGRVSDVVNAPANDVLELDSGISLPLVADCVLDVDLE
ncbi:MAG: ribosome maturation factor RimM, partial [Actinomycetota bacterium]|nr:ribosome maturation factor RimM [Actinomycetota bacterium]